MTSFRPVNVFAGANCNVVKQPIEPDLMAWDARSRVELDRLRKLNVVAVRYEANGCDVSLELLPDCIGPKNKYVYVPYNATDTKIAHNTNELLAQLPVGAANVTNLLDGKRALRTDFKLVGSLALPPGSNVTEIDFVGPECKQATHIISAVYVGGFAMAASDQKQVDTLGNLLVAPPSDGMTREGYAGICDQAQAQGKELGGCSVPLRLALLPIARTMDAVPSAGPRCTAGSVWNGSSCARVMEADDGDAGVVGGVFDQNAIERVVRQHQAAVSRACWDSAMDLKRATVSVQMTVDPRGQVINAEARTSDFEGPADVATVIARCMANEVRGWRFPEPDAQKVLTVPFHFIRQ